MLPEAVDFLERYESASQVEAPGPGIAGIGIRRPERLHLQVLDAAGSQVRLGGVDHFAGEVHRAHLLHREQTLQVRADQPVEALAAARKAVQLAPNDVQPHLTLAELLRAQKKYAEAEAELERVITLNPANEDAYLTLARYQVEQKAYDRARAVLLRLVDRQPRLAQAHFLLGRLAIETENWDEAIGRLNLVPSPRLVGGQ